MAKKKSSGKHKHSKPVKHKSKSHAKITKAKKAKSEKGITTLPLEPRKITTQKSIAMDFAEKVHKKFDRMVKASILFGSQARNEGRAKSDIDIILLIDDASINWDLELIAWYREELGKLISAQKYKQDIHLNTIKLTTWWQDMIYGDPVVINVLRYGEALIDSGGFFNPLKALLLQGRIRSTPEAVYNALQRSPTHLARSKMAMLNSIEGVYWSMIDAAQAALITAGKLPPSPEQVPEMLKTTFVEKGMLKIESVRQLRDIYVLHKEINHKEIHEVKGTDIDKWQDISEDFLVTMTKIIDQILEASENQKEE